jgi:sugar lactone lactonase YvrE
MTKSRNAMRLSPPAARLFTACLIGLLALPACQAGPSASGAPSLGLAPTAQGERLKLKVSLSARRIAALAADVETLVLTVHAADGREYQQTLARTDFGAGPGEATFSGLAPGTTLVTVTALGGTHVALGRTQRRLTLAGGLTTELAIDFYLASPDAAAPSAMATTSATLTATLVDGPLLPGPPVASPTPPPALGEVRLAWYDACFYLDGLAADAKGYIWMLADGRLQKLAQDAAIVVSVTPPAAGPIVVDRQDHLWLLGHDRLYRYAPGGEQRAAYSVPAADVPRRLAIDDAGQLWIAGPNQVLRLSPSGTVAETIPLPAEGGDIGVHPASGTLWVTLPALGKVMRFASSGQPLGTVIVNQFADPLSAITVDAAGNAWIAEPYTGLIAKIAPDGTHLGHFPTDNEVTLLTSDRDGNVYASAHLDTPNADRVTVKLLPNGRRAGTYPTDHVAGGVVDAAGHFWCLNGMTGRLNLLKIAP